jgi:hypothetical protein
MVYCLIVDISSADKKDSFFYISCLTCISNGRTN